MVQGTSSGAGKTTICKELLKRKDVKYVMPFENRGEECGVTLHHPHGQIYAYPFIPPVIKKEIEAFKKNNFIYEVKFLKGLKYFLDGHNQNQNNIIKFIDYCKSFENKKVLCHGRFIK